jgi:hypothetical protein
MALFRIVIGLITVYDTATRLWDLNLFYTDDGCYPRGTALKYPILLINLCMFLTHKNITTQNIFVCIISLGIHSHRV